MATPLARSVDLHNRINHRTWWLALDTVEAQLDAMSRDETTTLDDMVEAVRAMKRQYEKGSDK